MEKSDDYDEIHNEIVQKEQVGDVLTVFVNVMETSWNMYILLDVLLCSIAEYFYEWCRILAIP